VQSISFLWRSKFGPDPLTEIGRKASKVSILVENQFGCFCLAEAKACIDPYKI